MSLNILVITMSFHTYIAKVCSWKKREQSAPGEFNLEAFKDRFRAGTSIGSRGTRIHTANPSTKEVFNTIHDSGLYLF